MRLLLLCLILLTPLPLHADTPPPYVSVSAQGWVEAIPDTLVVTVVLRAAGKELDSLRDSVDKSTRQIVAVAREYGIKDDDIDSSRLSVRPEYEWNKGSRNYLGEVVQRDVVMKLRELDRFGQLLRELTRLDVQEIRPPQLQHSKLRELRLAALEVALDNGRDKAQRIARHLGVKLGKVIRVEESSNVTVPQPRMMAAEAMRSDAGAPEVLFGKQKIHAGVQLRFQID